MPLTSFKSITFNHLRSYVSHGWQGLLAEPPACGFCQRGRLGEATLPFASLTNADGLQRAAPGQGLASPDPSADAAKGTVDNVTGI